MYKYKTEGKITVHRTNEDYIYSKGTSSLVESLETNIGVLFSSNYNYPGRYTCWDIGFVNPPISISCIGLNFRIVALNLRGKIMLKGIISSIKNLNFIENLCISHSEVSGYVKKSTQYLSEDQRSKKPSIFSILRIIVKLFHSIEDKHLGLYGAFGYDLAYQFEDIKPKIKRLEGQRDLVLFIPDELLFIDHNKGLSTKYKYDFDINGNSTCGIERSGLSELCNLNGDVNVKCDHNNGQYIDCVEKARNAFHKGDLFEVVLSQTFYEQVTTSPSKIFSYIINNNQSPYACLMNLGDQEYLVGASPEMYVRVSGKRVETCPISGTIARGKDAIEDAENILELLQSSKDESELTMCTDVDRNDKSRICTPGTVRVIGRRQIEMYSEVIHTVDHIEGQLDDNFDGIDAFLTHMWAVTVTGAPKVWAMQFLEEHEKSARKWYGGAIGKLGFDGDINTGLTLRTICIKQGIAEIRAGATLLYDSDPVAEEAETRLKALAFIDALKQSDTQMKSYNNEERIKSGVGKNIVIIDHQDSFVHTLANYFRQTGAKVITFRYDVNFLNLKEIKPDLIVLSPGPGRPCDFNLGKTIEMAIKLNARIFGVCLGLQGIVEYFGGELDTLSYPIHGKQSKIELLGGRTLHDLPETIYAGRYHSLYCVAEKMPKCLKVTAISEDGIVMAIEHESLPISAVQFHPESILTLNGDIGFRIINNVVNQLSEKIS
jgi:anthranilate synthase